MNFIKSIFVASLFVSVIGNGNCHQIEKIDNVNIINKTEIVDNSVTKIVNNNTFNNCIIINNNNGSNLIDSNKVNNSSNTVKSSNNTSKSSSIADTDTMNKLYDMIYNKEIDYLFDNKNPLVFELADCLNKVQCNKSNIASLSERKEFVENFNKLDLQQKKNASKVFYELIFYNLKKAPEYNTDIIGLYKLFSNDKLSDKSKLSWGRSINLAILNSIIFNKIDTEKSIELKEAKNDDEFRQGMEKINYCGYWSNTNNILRAVAPSDITRSEYNVIVKEVNEQKQIPTLNNFILLFNEIVKAKPNKEAPKMADSEGKANGTDAPKMKAPEKAETPDQAPSNGEKAESKDSDKAPTSEIKNTLNDNKDKKQDSNEKINEDKSINSKKTQKIIKKIGKLVNKLKNINN